MEGGGHRVSFNLSNNEYLFETRSLLQQYIKNII